MKNLFFPRHCERPPFSTRHCEETKATRQSRLAWMALIIWAALTLFAAPAAWAGTTTLTFGWNQEIGEGFAGWKLYRSTNPGVPVDSAALFATIPYGGAVQTDYQSSQPLTSPDGQSVTYYFVLTAFDTAGNESGPSNEVQVEIDFEAPAAPFSLSVTVERAP